MLWLQQGSNPRCFAAGAHLRPLRHLNISRARFAAIYNGVYVPIYGRLIFLGCLKYCTDLSESSLPQQLVQLQVSVAVFPLEEGHAALKADGSDLGRVVVLGEMVDQLLDRRKANGLVDPVLSIRAVDHHVAQLQLVVVVIYRHLALFLLRWDIARHH